MICTTFAPSGNPFGPAAAQAKPQKELPETMKPALSVGQVKQVRSARKNGVSYGTLMAMYGLSRETLARAVAGRSTYKGF